MCNFRKSLDRTWSGSPQQLCVICCCWSRCSSQHPSGRKYRLTSLGLPAASKVREGDSHRPSPHLTARQVWKGPVVWGFLAQTRISDLKFKKINWLLQGTSADQVIRGSIQELTCVIQPGVCSSVLNLSPFKELKNCSTFNTLFFHLLIFYFQHQTSNITALNHNPSALLPPCYWVMKQTVFLFLHSFFVPSFKCTARVRRGKCFLNKQKPKPCRDVLHFEAE